MCPKQIPPVQCAYNDFAVAVKTYSMKIHPYTVCNRMMFPSLWCPQFMKKIESCSAVCCLRTFYRTLKLAKMKRVPVSVVLDIFRPKNHTCFLKISGMAVLGCSEAGVSGPEFSWLRSYRSARAMQPGGPVRPYSSLIQKWPRCSGLGHGCQWSN
jgi:hypothetical protein